MKWNPSRQVSIKGAQRKDIDKLGKGAIAFYNGDGASRSDFQNLGTPDMVSEYGSTSCNRPGSFSPGWGDLSNGYNRLVWRSGQVIWCGFDHGTNDIHTICRMAEGKFGYNISFVRVQFTSRQAGLAEVRVGGNIRKRDR